jgi:glutamate synthase domain-containing protein 2
LEAVKPFFSGDSFMDFLKATLGVIGLVTLLAISFFVIVFLYDYFQKKNNIRRIFPFLGNFRFMMLELGPAIRQYIVAGNREETPFNRVEREWIYSSANKSNNYTSFGTDDIIQGIGYPIIKNSTIPYGNLSLYQKGITQEYLSIPCHKIIGRSHNRKRPYRPRSLINISAMSFGAISANAITALNIGSGIAQCFHNCGEGSVSPYHRMGGDLVYQLGTGNFGCRDSKGRFDLEKLVGLVARTPKIRAIEIKISQGAKPGKGGVLPGAKVSSEIAEIRGIPEGIDCISPNKNPEFDSPDSLIDFVEKIASATGLPVGFKTAVGKLDFLEELAERMKERGEGPDFITVDGGEGGTGAAPVTFADHVSLPYITGFSRLYQIFLKHGLTNDITFIGSGKLGFPDRLVVAMALGADLIQVARESMLAIGCIQAQKCHTGFCPSGIATQNKYLQRGVVPTSQGQQLANYFETFNKETLGVTHASGYVHPSQFTTKDIERSSGVDSFKTLEEIHGYVAVRPVIDSPDWKNLEFPE